MLNYGKYHPLFYRETIITIYYKAMFRVNSGTAGKFNYEMN